MRTDDLDRSLTSLFSELVFGAPESFAFVLNRGDRGLLASLDELTADAASSSLAGGGSIAAHVRHLAYGLSLMNRWAAGENPFNDADWSAAWAQNRVASKEWDTLRSALREECTKWHENLGVARSIKGPALDGVIGSIVHLAYHLGAIRQINPSVRGPTAND